LVYQWLVVRTDPESKGVVVMDSGTAPSHGKLGDRCAMMGAEDIKLLPDASSAEFKAEARRQSGLIARSPHEADDQGFVDSLSD
jgi:hypothetical protein